jgi:hypothetical protein
MTQAITSKIIFRVSKEGQSGSQAIVFHPRDDLNGRWKKWTLNTCRPRTTMRRYFLEWTSYEKKYFKG